MSENTTYNHDTVFAAELCWPDYAERVSNGEAMLLIPIGSMEQHGHHMPMHVDVLLPTEFSRRIANEVDALVTQPFVYGYKSHPKSGGGNHLPGTTSLDGATMISALKDIIKEYARHGARKITLMNGHFENSWFIIEGVDVALRELRWDGINDVKIVVLSYWDFVTDETIEKLYPDGFSGWDIEHGGVLETSLMMSLYPNLVQLDRAVDHPPATFPPYDVYPVNPDWIPPSGTLSSPAQASKEKGDILLEVCTKGIVEALTSEFGLSDSKIVKMRTA
ncbi:MAG: creatininase [Alphaproteobacteria bacterium]|jgi:creatinine amidohydrolase|nr:creatininase [Alphaproteobacteria bacterium]MBT4083498.1 creatininase [Alphaproteobacteria bacterium]MBT4544943.1 creatininase [Alphaproteobacteria bacterium]MBT7743698.1 creatininase [Alphaproteobacteria bacterium]